MAMGAHDHEKPLTGLAHCPKPFLLAKSNDGVNKVKVVNNMFFVWKRFAKLLMSWLISSISGDLFNVVSGYRSVNEMWKSLEA